MKQETLILKSQKYHSTTTIFTFTKDVNLFSWDVKECHQGKLFRILWWI